MLIIKNYIAVSKIPHAWFGCFSDQDVTEWQIVSRFDEDIDIVVRKEKYDLFSQPKKHYYDMYASLEKDDKGLILILSADNTRFLNHSDNPNIACPDPFTLIAIRDIKKDEELTINYRTIDENMKHYNGSLEEYFKKMDL